MMDLSDLEIPEFVTWLDFEMTLLGRYHQITCDGLDIPGITEKDATIRNKWLKKICMTNGGKAQSDFDWLTKQWSKMNIVPNKQILANAVAERSARVEWYRHQKQGLAEPYKGKMPIINEPIQEEYEKIRYMRMI
jgi:hypothetical protein